MRDDCDLDLRSARENGKKDLRDHRGVALITVTDDWGAWRREEMKEGVQVSIFDCWWAKEPGTEGSQNGVMITYFLWDSYNCFDD